MTQEIKEAAVDTRECPHCRMTVDARATTCPYCQKRLDTNTGRYHAGSFIGAMGLLALVGGIAMGSGGVIGLGAILLLAGLTIRGSG